LAVYAWATSKLLLSFWCKTQKGKGQQNKRLNNSNHIDEKQRYKKQFRRNNKGTKRAVLLQNFQNTKKESPENFNRSSQMWKQLAIKMIVLRMNLSHTKCSSSAMNEKPSSNCRI
jgi:hypothetical protein